MSEGLATILIVVGVLAFLGVAWWVLRGLGFGRKPLPVDPTMGDLRAAAIREAFQLGDAAVLEQELASLEGDPDRSFLLSILGDDSDADLPWLDNWVERNGKASGLPWLVRGIHRIKLGGKARGKGMASTVGADARREFLKWIELAENDLVRSGELRPQDAEPFAFRIGARLARGAEKSELRELFRQATQRDPLNYTAHQSLMNALTRKWGGSHEQMFEVAEEAFAQSSANGELAVILLHAHVERWLYFNLEGRQEEGYRYFQQEQVLADVERADEVLSGRSGAPLTELQKRLVANDLAFSFWKTDQQDRLAQALRVMGEAVAETPWCYTAHGPAVVTMLRLDCEIETD